ncbi:hypothetical protein BV22DRAFT_355569 [Leucogyrophana mollusca]|uniref:Uncharacterized protein n=1 Tax=Leucogyrophana mollusca TaxID=85980 RepID=A0ACB8BKH8_9AGAM|nr:hypothetical protein BV22DRAFT_355569 [Leucogyrophana mollusca]
MESEYDVCVECGSLVECEHDHEPGEHPPRPPTLGGTHPAEIVTNPPAITTKDSDADADTLEMRMVRPIPPHTEVFNTYGALTNAALLARYGFLLDANEWDVVSMPISSSLTQGFLRVAREHSNEESDKDNKSGGATGRRPPRNTTTTPGGGDWAYDTVGGKHGMLCASENRSRGDGTFIVGGGEATSRDAYEVGGDGRKAAAHFQDGDLVISLFERVARTWDCEALWDADDGDENETQALVYNPPPSTSRGKEVVLCLNSDGKLSHHLWIFCALVAFSVHLPDLVVEGNLDALKRRMLRVQEYVERAQLRGEDSESESSGASAGPDSALLSEEGGTGTSTLDVGTICLSHSHSKQATASTRPFQGTIPTALFQLLPSSEARVESNRRRLTDINIADVVVGEAEGERPVKRVRRSRSSSPPLLEDQRSSNFGLSGGGPDCTGLEYNLGEDEGFLDHRIARSLVRVVVCFCRERFEGMGAAELGEILDRTPSWMHRTRTALGIAVGEKSIVESCAATWEGLLD